MPFRYFIATRKICSCGRALQKRGGFLASSFSTRPVHYNNAKYKESWRHELPYSDTLFHYQLEVPIVGMLHLTTGCNSYVKSRYVEDEPNKKVLDVKIYAKGDQGVKVEDLQKIVDRVHKFRKIVRHKFTGYPPLVRVDFPHLQKYRNEIKNCLAIVVEMPYQYGMVADVTHWGNLCIQDFENEYTSGYTEFGDIELSKVKTQFADIFSGSDIYCHNHFIGSGQFICTKKGDIFMKKLQGVHFAMDGLIGDVETESVYCKDVVYTNELGDVTTGVVNTTGCHVETETGKIKVDSVSSDKFFGRIFKTGVLDVTVEKANDFYIYHGEGGDTNIKVGPGIDLDLVAQSKTSSVSSDLDFSSLEKYTDHIHKYKVTKGKMGDNPKPWKIENHFGHVTIEKGDWLRSLKLKFPNLNP